MAGARVAAARVRVTGMVLVVAPVAVTETVALYVPAAKPVRFTLVVTVPVLVPDAGDKVNHAAVLLAVQARVPPPVLEILNVVGAGLAPPAVPEKARLLRLS